MKRNRLPRLFLQQELFIKPAYIKEGIGVALGGLTVYSFIALIAYSWYGGVLMSVSSEHHVVTHQMIGTCGFYGAAFFIYFFGVMGHAVPLLFGLVWYEYTYHRASMHLLRVGAAGVVSCLLTAFFSLIQAAFAFPWLPVHAGGALGNFCYYLISGWFGMHGTAILLSVLIWWALCVMFAIPLVPVIRWWLTAAMSAFALCVYTGAAALFFVIKLLVTGVKILVLFGVRVVRMVAVSVRWAMNAFREYRAVKRYVAVVCDETTWLPAAENKEGIAGDNELSESNIAGGMFNEEFPLVDQVSDHTVSSNDRVWEHYPVHQSAVVRGSGPYKQYGLRNTVVKKNIFSFDSDLDGSWFDYAQRIMAQRAVRAPSYEPPSFSLFTPPAYEENAEHFITLCQERAHRLEEKLGLFGIKGNVVAIRPGPVITLFEYRPDSTSKVSRILALEDDLALALTAHSIRIIAPIPGRDVVGFEIAHHERRTVFFSEILLSSVYANTTAHLPLIFGVDVVGSPVVTDLVSLPHLLIGGTTGSGKSVGLNTMLMSLLCSKGPDELRLILIDPKRLEFTPYADIPHLHFPIVTDVHRAAKVLKWLVQEMERRYELLARVGVRNIVDYQALYAKSPCDEQGRAREKMPFMVLMIDELADLMMVAAKEVEISITRLAQMARAAGIHIIVATQRPSVDVVTGIIKVNFPSRIGFRVSSKIDSRTILDRVGAEKLLGKGDMLFMHSAAPAPERIHGCFLSQHEIERYAQALRAKARPTYLDLDNALVLADGADSERDELYDTVVDFIKTTGEISISLIQRQYRIGFNRSARIIEQLELDGLITPAQGSKPRKVIR